LIEAKKYHDDRPQRTMDWAADLDDDLYAQLSDKGLVPARKKTEPEAVLTLKAMFDAYIARRTDLKPASILVWDQVRKHLCRQLGENRDVRTLTTGECKDADRRRLRQSRWRECNRGCSGGCIL
jgi:hypothetical protein